MTPETGRVLRRIAYLIEATCMLGLLSIARQGGEPGRFAGLALSQWLSTGLAMGISLWIVGTSAVYWPRGKPRDPK